jgi:hemoglobin-like flavoprotein
MTTLAMVVHALHQPGRVLPVIRDLAVRHVECAVKLADYDTRWEALLWTLERVFGEYLTRAVREAWTVCYFELAGEMKGGGPL